MADDKNIPPLNEKKTPEVDYNSVKNNDQNNATQKAHEQADEDIAKDPDLSIHSPNDDLDEGETARLGEDKTDLV